MTLKYEDLEEFIFDFKRKGFEKISTNQLHFSIGKRFGVSPYIRKNVIKSLVDYGFIKEDTLGVWKITWKAEKETESEEDVDKFDELMK
jgi:hypothetical protein